MQTHQTHRVVSRRWLVTVLLVIAASACTSAAGDATENTTAESTSSSSVETAIADAAGDVRPATYRSATVYAGSTDYSFEDVDGELIRFRVSNLPDEQTVELPGDLLEPDPLEGPPGPNPELLGAEFLLIYNSDGELIRVQRSE